MTGLGHVGPQPGSSIEQDFWEFHQRHPQVYRELVRLTREWAARAHERGQVPKLGIATVYEHLRWRVHMGAVQDAAGFKLNNSYRSLFARLIMEREPDLAGVFETRRLRAPEPFDGRLFSELEAA